MSARDAKAAVREACKAHTRLNTFYAVIAVLEGGCLPGGSETASASAQKIIRICQQEADRQLRLYDAATARALTGKAGEA